MKKERFYKERYAKAAKGDIDDRLKKVIDTFSAHKHNISRILDVGCGNGNFSILLKETCNAKEVYGIDISKEGKESAKKNGVKAFQLNIDEENFPFENAYFDAVFCGEIIEHLYDPDHLLDEIHRTLKEGGLSVITTPNLASWHNRVVLLFGFQPHSTEVSLRYNVGKVKPKPKELDMSGHIRVFTCRSLKALLALHGFGVSKMTGAHEAKLFPFPLNIMERIFSMIPSFSSKMIFVVNKKNILRED